MSRIFTVVHIPTGTPRILKVTDTTTSLGGFEHDGYDMMAREGLPAPRIYYTGRVDMYHVFVMEKLECTMTTLLLAYSTNTVAFEVYKKKALNCIGTFLDTLQERGVSFVDFKTDNIMCRVDASGHVEFVLIDPQFIVPIADLALVMGTSCAASLDRVHVCAHFMSICMLYRDEHMRACAKELCVTQLGYLLTTREVVAVLTVLVPNGIRAAHGIHKKKSMETS